WRGVSSPPSATTPRRWSARSSAWSAHSWATRRWRCAPPRRSSTAASTPPWPPVSNSSASPTPCCAPPTTSPRASPRSARSASPPSRAADMKPAPFAYVRPTRLADVVGELVAAEAAGGGKGLAGGQSLAPVLAMRLGRPRTLVDLTRVAELGQIGHDGGSLRIGAAVRQRHVERTAGGDVPLLAQALPWVGHREIRSRGTVCGSLAHADPSAELPAVALCLGATLDVAGPDGRRRIAAEEFFTGAMSTALGPADVLASVQFP